jgi:hypothetical protein
VQISLASKKGVDQVKERYGYGNARIGVGSL